MSSERPVDRRRFFIQGLRELLKPLAEAAEPIERAMRELESYDRAVEPSVNRAVFLRPPGALSEQPFRETCSRCGECVAVCPAEAIKLDPTGARGDGAPYIVPSESPCVACDGLQCMQICPSGALVPTPLALIDMGTAVWHKQHCVRTTRGESCTLCVDHCPMGTAALTIDGNRIKVIEEGCIGCGLCENYCPTSPKSITVSPRRNEPPMHADEPSAAEPQPK